MVLINKIFAILLMASLMGMLVFTVTDTYYDDYGLTASSEMDALNSNFTYTKNVTSSTTDSQRTAFGSTNNTDFTDGLISTGYQTFTGLLSAMSNVDALLSTVGSMLGLPAFVMNIFYTILLVSFIISLALILMRLGVF